MNFILRLSRWHASLARALDRLQPLLLLATRFYVGWQFTKSGWLKISSWDTTLGLFRDEYHVPLLPPDVAAVMGTCGELGFPILLYLGLFTRIGALGTLFVNVMAVVSYRDVLLSEGFEAALGQHVLWGTLLAALFIHGPGRWSADALASALGGKARFVAAAASGPPA